MFDRASRFCTWLLTGIALGAVSMQSFAEQPERWAYNMTEGVTAISRDIYGLHMDIFYWCVGIGVVVFGVMFYTMIAHRKANGAKASNFHENTFLEIIWTVVPFILLIIMALPATKTLREIYDTKDADLDIVITGYQWYWKYEYLGEEVSFFSRLTTPTEEIRNQAVKNKNYLLEVDEPLVIPEGKKVRFLVTANDVIHSWWVPDLAVKRDAIPGFMNTAWTQAEEPGVYRGQCAELCGKDHGFMPIVVKVLPQAEFEVWLAERKATAAKLKELTNKTFNFDEMYSQGEVVYNKVCAACHQPNGKGLPPTFPAIAGSKIATGPVSGHLDMVINGSPDNPTMAAFGPQLSEVEIAAVITYQRNAFGNNMGDTVQPIDVLKAKQAK